MTLLKISYSLMRERAENYTLENANLDLYYEKVVATSQLLLLASSEDSVLP